MLPVFVIRTFDWDTAMPSHSQIFYGSFHATVAGVNSCNKNGMAHKTENISYLALYRKCLLILHLGVLFHFVF